MDLDFAGNGVLYFITHHFNVLEEHHALECAKLKCLHSVIDTEHNHTSVKSDSFKELSNYFLFVHKLHICQCVCAQCYCLVQSVVLSIAYVDYLEDDIGNSLVKVV